VQERAIADFVLGHHWRVYTLRFATGAQLHPRRITGFSRVVDHDAGLQASGRQHETEWNPKPTYHTDNSRPGSTVAVRMWFTLELEPTLTH
jgi:hypothetical protein